MDAAQQQAVDQAARNIMLELNLRQQALERAVQTVYEADAYEVTKVAEVFLTFLPVSYTHLTLPTIYSV